LTTGQLVQITFPAGFTGVGSLLTGDITVTVNGTPDAHSNFSAAGAPIISFDGVDATDGQIVRVQIAGGKVTNPASIQSYEFVIATPVDTGKTRVAIVNYVQVTAIVPTTFNFVVSGIATSTQINTAIATTTASTTGASTATTIPFGTLAAGSIYTLAQDLAVTTNAKNGFVVTVQQDTNLESSTGADIDGFSNGTYVNTPAAWSAPTNSLLLENTWGHWGLSSDDSNHGSNEFAGGGKWVAASTTPRSIFSHTGPADGVTQDYGSATIAYQVQITPLQEAGDDYNTTLMYIATPTF